MFKLGALRIYTPQGKMWCDEEWNLSQYDEEEEDIIYSHKSFWHVFEMVKLLQDLHAECGQLLYSIIMLYGTEDVVELWSNFVLSIPGEPLENLETALKYLFESKSFDHEDPNHPDVYKMASESSWEKKDEVDSTEST